MDGMYNGTPFLSDDRTGSLWTMVTMKPVYGDAVLKGPLRRLPMVHASWTEWRRLHPETLVVNDPGEPDGGHGDSHRWAGHDTLPAFSNNTRLTPVDPRIRPIDVVAGVVVNASPRCYPLDLLHEKSPVVNDVVGGRPVVVVTIPGTYIALILYREVDDVVVELEWQGGPEAAVAAVTNDSEPPLLVDRVTGTRWNLFGTAVDGPLAGAQLAHGWGGVQKWFNWSNLEPRSEIWGVDKHLGGDGGPWASSVPGGVRGEPRAIEFARRSASQAHDHVDAVGNHRRGKKRREVTDHVH
jgi:hypothetical protein